MNELLSLSFPSIFLTIILFIISIIIHEAGHNLIRLNWTYYPQNKKNFNFDFFGILLIPFFSILRLQVLTGYSAIDKEDILFSKVKSFKILFGGILANIFVFVFIILISKLFFIINIFYLEIRYIKIIKDIFFYFLQLQINLIILNLIPIPPTDMGVLILRIFNIKDKYFEYFGGFILFIILNISLIDTINRVSSYITHIVLSFSLLYLIIINFVIIFLCYFYFYSPRERKNKKSETILFNN